jgi:hypothetical protein
VLSSSVGDRSQSLTAWGQSGGQYRYVLTKESPHPPDTTSQSPAISAPLDVILEQSKLRARTAKRADVHLSAVTRPQSAGRQEEVRRGAQSLRLARIVQEQREHP